MTATQTPIDLGNSITKRVFIGQSNFERETPGGISVTSVGTENRTITGNVNLSSRMPMFLETRTQAVDVVRLGYTHSSVSPESKSQLFDNVSATRLEANYDAFDSLSSTHPPSSNAHNVTTYYSDASNSRLKSGRRSCSRTAKSPIHNNESTELSHEDTGQIIDIHSLLTAVTNRRPSSRQSVLHQKNDNQKEVVRCDTAKSNQIILSEIDNEISSIDTNYINGNSAPSTASLKKKKGKKSKKRSKSSLGSKSKTKSSSKVYQYGKMKVPAATNVKANKENSPSSDNKFRQFSSLSDVLQAQGKPITLLKPELPNGTKSMDQQSSKQRAASEPYNTKRIQASKSVQGNNISLPQVTNSLVLKSCPVSSKAATITEQSTLNSTKFLLPSYNPRTVYGGQSHSHEITKTVKVFLSEKHSGTVRDCGMEIPCAPPVTPTPEQLRKVEYIPSMNDIRAQRAVKIKLQVLEKEASKKLEKQKEEKAKQEKLQQKDREKEFKMHQRNEIYALNKIMTELENKQFKDFCARKSISI